MKVEYLTTISIEGIRKINRLGNGQNNEETRCCGTKDIHDHWNASLYGSRNYYW